MSCTAAPPDGTHVANTRPLLGAFVTVTGCSPVRVLAAVTQRVWPLEFPQLLLASAFPGIRTVAATSTQKTPREARRFRDEPITSRLPPFGPIRFSLASRRSPCLSRLPLDDRSRLRAHAKKPGRHGHPKATRTGGVRHRAPGVADLRNRVRRLSRPRCG